MIELYIYISGVAYLVELSDNISITLHKAIKDLRDVTSSLIPKTLPIQLPNTQTNRTIFSSYQDFNIVDSGINHLSDISVELYVNGISLINGKLQILGLKRDKSTIDIVIYDRAISIFSILKNENLASLDFSDFDFTISDANVISSWNETLNAGKTIYPLADNGQGFGYQDPDNAGTVFDISVNANINPNVLVPAVSVSEILTRMLDNAISRTDVNSWSINGLDNWLEDLFFLNNIKPEEAQSSPVDLTAIYSGNIYDIDSPPGDFHNVNISYASGNSVLISAGGLIAVHTGNYNVNLDLSLIISDSNPSGVAELRAFKNGVDFSSIQIFNESGTATVSTTYALTVGDVLTFVLQTYQSAYIDSFSIVGDVLAVGTAGLVISSGKIYFNNLFKEINKADFLRELVKMFDLIIEVDENNILQITPYNDIISGTDTIDLSDYILERNFSILSPYKVMSKTLKFNYKEGKDYANKLYERDLQQRYGSGEFESNIPFLSNTFDSELGVSPFMPVQLQNAKRGATAITNLTGIKNVNSPQNLDPDSYSDRYFMFFGGKMIASSSYKIGTTNTTDAPIFSNFKRVGTAAIDTTINDLNYFFTAPISEMELSFAAGFDSVNSATLFNEFYDKHISELYSSDAKLIEVSAVVDPETFNSLYASRKIIVNSGLFRAIDISYNLKNGVAKLVLLKLKLDINAVDSGVYNAVFENEENYIFEDSENLIFDNA